MAGHGRRKEIGSINDQIHSKFIPPQLIETQNIEITGEKATKQP